MLKCDAAAGITNYCFDVTVNGAPAPSTLGLVARMTAYKTHDASVSNAQYEAMFHLYRVPSTGTFSTSDVWGVGRRPQDQDGGNGKVDLTGVLTANDVVKVTARFKMHTLPQYSVLVAADGTMSFALSGNDLTLTMEGKPARVALESAAQHIDFDTEKSDDTTKPWTDRCGIPSMKFVVCNVDRAESNPLVFYGRSSTMVNPPAADIPGPIWVSTNATYFHQPSVAVDSKGNPQIQVRVASPHLLADGTTVNSGAFRAFISNGMLERWKIPKTEDGLNKALAASVKKAGVETVVTYSSPEVFVTAITSTTGGSQNANQVYQALIAGTMTSNSTSSTPSSAAKNLKKGSATVLSRLIAVTKGQTPTWSVKGTGCRISAGKLVAVTKGRTCTLTLKQRNTKTKVLTTKTLTIKVV
ncbi:MAG: hypothetical protein EBT79_03100 [Actinobacteria bacterium]|nr:hypothetical protein [Actinomycetota bacterium]